MEAVRQKMIIFRYQLLHIGAGKKYLSDTLHDVQPEITRYEDIVKQIKFKIQERRALLEEKKAVPAIQVFRHRELAQKIAGLTEDIEELKSEKAMLLNQFNCADDHGMTVVKQHVASMESSLDKLDKQEDKYAAELETALAQYTELQQQVADIDTTELDIVRQAMQTEKEQATVQSLHTIYGKHFNSQMLAQSRNDVADLLGEVTESASIRQKLQQSQQKEHRRSHEKERSQER